MNGRKWLGLLLVLTLTLCAATAAAQSVAPIPSTIDTQHLAHREYCAGIQGYDAAANTMTVVLYQPEEYLASDVEALVPGDTIRCGGEEIVVETVRYEPDQPYYLINDGADEFADGTLMLGFNPVTSAYYQLQLSNYPNWQPIATLTVEVPECIVLLDRVDVDTGEPLTVPRVYTAAEFVRMLTDSQTDELSLGFDMLNLYILFDENNQPVVVRRFYVSWQ